LTNYGEFYRPAVNEAEKGIFIRRSDAPGKTGLKRTLSHLENCDYKQWQFSYYSIAGSKVTTALYAKDMFIF
jgi:hypothetical protein